ncbi:methyl-accepting chemotaxis protein [Marinobacter sp.]|uniref:methyl-accepting chemotaxis protein n=1 Tax=Marinobacter sp. TaxID=50741 RepID=UPI003A94FFBF
MLTRLKSRYNFSLAIFVIFMIVVTLTSLNAFVAPKLASMEGDLISQELTLIGNDIQKELAQVQAQQRAITQLVPELSSDQIDAQLPALLDQYGELKVFGGGIWPLPGERTSGRDRHSTFYHRDSQGRMIVNTYWNSAEAPPYYNEPWYQNGRNSPRGECAWAKAYEDDASAEPRTNCAMGIYRGSQLYGVATIDVTLGFFNELVAESEQHIGGDVMVVERDGTIVSNSGAVRGDIVLQNVSNLASRGSLTKALANEDLGRVESFRQPYQGVEGEDLTLLVVAIDGTPWVLAASVPTELLQRQSNGLIKLLLAFQVPLLLVLLIVIAVVLQRLLARLNRLRTSIDDLSAGEADLTRRLPTGKGDELDDIASSTNGFIQYLQGMIKDIAGASGRIDQSMASLQDGATNSRQILEAHVGETDQVVTAITELSATSDDVAKDANRTADFVSQVSEQAKESQALVRQATDAMDSLLSRIDGVTAGSDRMRAVVDQITPMLGTISDIADQTNLLALNAAIEAARAGDQGRGFAVVADEVRALAARTRQSTEEIDSRLTDLTKGMEQMVRSIEETRESSGAASEANERVNRGLDEVASAVQEIQQLSAQIATAAEEQSSVSRQVDANMISIRHMVDDLVAQGETNERATADMIEANHELVSRVRGFRTD